MRRFFVLAFAFMLGCGPTGHEGDDGDDDSPGHEFLGIVIEPTNPIVELDLDTTGQQQFQAIAKYRDGVDEDITDQVSWVVHNPAVGQINTSAQLNIPAFPVVSVETSLITAALHDGVEGQAQITVVAYRRTGPQQDFFFVLPYEDAAGPQTKPLEFSTTVPSADIFLLMDTTGSMGGEIVGVRDALTSTIIPQVQAQLANTQFGAGHYEDFPLSPYGQSCTVGGVSRTDQPFKLLQPITATASLVQTAVNSMVVDDDPIGCGNDIPESGIEAMYQVATGDGLNGPSSTNVPANHTGVGGVDFREDSMPVIVNISDAISHGDGEAGSCSGTLGYDANVSTTAHTRAETKTVLDNICARVVGIATNATGSCSAQAYLEDFATHTGARVTPAAWDVGTRPANCASNQCCTAENGAGRAPDADGKCPLVFRTDSSGTGISSQVVTGLKMLTRFASFDVTSETEGTNADLDGETIGPPETTADFIESITPTGFTVPPAPPVLPNPTFDATTFRDVTPGTKVEFDVVAYNDFVPQGDVARIFMATIRVLAGGCTPLDERDVVILVPPNPIAVE